MQKEEQCTDSNFYSKKIQLEWHLIKIDSWSLSTVSNLFFLHFPPRFNPIEITLKCNFKVTAHLIYYIHVRGSRKFNFSLT